MCKTLFKKVTLTTCASLSDVQVFSLHLLHHDRFDVFDVYSAIFIRVELLETFLECLLVKFLVWVLLCHNCLCPFPEVVLCEVTVGTGSLSFHSVEDFLGDVADRFFVELEVAADLTDLHLL